MNNHFDYFSDIEATFIRRRGKNLFLSPKDWSLMSDWEKRGIPLHIPISVIEDAFDKTDNIRSLAYCVAAVEDKYKDWLTARVGGGGTETVKTYNCSDCLAIVGIPGTGKSTLAAEMGGGRSTDEVMHLGWDEATEAVSHWFDEPYSIIEGVAVPRALRLWRERNPGQPPPVDKVIHLRTVHQQHPDAEAMGKGINTVLKELWPWLMTRY